MSKQTKKTRIDTVSPAIEKDGNTFYFGRENYKWMIIGLVFIVIGFLLMMGPDANTVDGKYDPNLWNEGIFSIRRIRIAPLLVITGFVIEIYAILKRRNI